MKIEPPPRSLPPSSTGAPVKPASAPQAITPEDAAAAAVAPHAPSPASPRVAAADLSSLHDDAPVDGGMANMIRRQAENDQKMLAKGYRVGKKQLTQPPMPVADGGVTTGGAGPAGTLPAFDPGEAPKPKP